MKAKESESTHFVTFAQAAALNGPMTKLEAAQCLLGVAGTIFGPENAERVAVAIGKRMNLSEADLLPGMAKLRPRKKADGGKSDKRVALTPYTLFLCYAMKELYKQKEELPVIKDFLKQHGDGGKINFQTAIQIWRSLPCDKERLDVLKPFLDAINKDRLLRKQQLPGGASGGGAGEPAAEACERYLQYVADHPEASFVRLLKLDGSIDGLGAPGGPSAATSTKGTAAAGAGAARLLGSRGPVTTAMDVDSASADSSSDQDEEEEDEDMAEVGEDEEIVKAGVSGSGSEGAGAGQFSTPAAAMTQKDEDAEEEEGSESESTPGSGGAGSSGRESDGSGTSGGAGGGFARGEENGGRDEDGDREGEGPGCAWRAHWTWTCMRIPNFPCFTNGVDAENFFELTTHSIHPFIVPVQHIVETHRESRDIRL
ncbi:hypothetical protein VOLCADRAFT_106574 [Volvox carteri f. nagariensis]|uniref:Uncharacterized protein n=1 Tax=Volvox carteri f. nagariensis TaxID=3068 RepID=D8U8A4_VOLCA|nr:uncharacterized protein VOLCADRAFT_106574 [Volvox carteri f. nagariensis]EFJ44054.1 hypothetical protein VOLCADRAFT_106574 [Volvox carteri f. nagariensis]|eukprot:XP_002954855.1 hypothetical protein VOLCADRAFT_106574 [Volvox carteri f. nagariensis]